MGHNALNAGPGTRKRERLELIDTVGNLPRPEP
jgi:hypothetical protein